ncbi:MAG TPA: hypothetical protein VF181_12715 [Balneolaceae bacterium]
MIYTVTYTGPFGYIKPWTAVRDELTFSQQFLTPSIIEGIRQKLQVKQILRHRLSFVKFSKQQEQTRPKLIKKPGKNYSILTRGILIDPVLVLAFCDREDAERAFGQHICLCRNEDVMLPDRIKGIEKLSEEKFSEIEGFELHFTKPDEGFMVGYNRFDNFKPMYGRLEITNGAIRDDIL